MVLVTSQEIMPKLGEGPVCYSFPHLIHKIQSEVHIVMCGQMHPQYFLCPYQVM